MVASTKHTNYQWFRISLLIVLLGGVGLALGRSLLISKLGEPVTVQPIALPADLPISDWKLVSSQEIQERSLKSPQKVTPDLTTTGVPVFGKTPVASGRSYQYRQGDRTLQVEARYLTNTQGNVSDLLATHPSGDYYTHRPSITLREQASVGVYGLFAIQGKTYLSTCINPKGGATFTRQQFVTHHLQSDLTPDHLWRWLSNQVEIPDRRCVWVYMVMADLPSSNTSQTLESAWLNWYAEWRSQVIR